MGCSRKAPPPRTRDGGPVIWVDTSRSMLRRSRKWLRRETAHLAPSNSGFGYVDVGSGPPSQTLLDIENRGVRMTLRDIQQDPAYAEIINDCLDEVEGLVRDREGGMT